MELEDAADDADLAFDLAVDGIAETAKGAADLGAAEAAADVADALADAAEE